uniref:Uncharacterized protein n=1 Tax=Anguilla anguilla TaxID=7936 RepID=A0A0E9X8B1_ANGAN
MCSAKCQDTFLMNEWGVPLQKHIQHSLPYVAIVWLLFIFKLMSSRAAKEQCHKGICHFVQKHFVATSCAVVHSHTDRQC